MHRQTISSWTALLIDGLGTLVSLPPPAPVLRRELAHRFGLELSEAEVRRALAAEIDFYRAHMGEGRDDHSLGSLRRRCAEVLRDALPRSDRLMNLDLDSLTAALLDSLRFAPFADARDALVAARARHARVIVVSNWDVSLPEVLERIGLAPLVDGVVTSAAVGAHKPDPAIFEHALALAGTAPERTIHVGDSLTKDVAGARACGIGAVLLRRSGEPAPDAPPRPPAPPGVVTITGLAQLAQL